MIEVEVEHDVGLGEIGIAVEKTQGLRLHWTSQEQRHLLEDFRQLGHQGLAHLVARLPVEHQAKRSLHIVLADQNDAAMEKGSLKPAVVEEQLAFQRWLRCRHSPPANRSVRQTCLAGNLV